jgi:ribonucrease Y
METTYIIIISALLIIIAFVVGMFISRRIGEKKVAKAEERATKIIAEAEKEAEVRKKEAL